MKLASFLTKYSMALTIGSLVLFLFLLISVAFMPSDLLKQVVGTLAFVSFILMFVFPFAGYFLYSIRNAALRRYGKVATATVLDAKWTGITSSSGQHVSRIKLEVHPPDEALFVAVAEDAYFMWDFYDGQQVNVRYDPRTKEVALVMPKKIKAEDF